MTFVQVRIPGELRDAIDAERGDVPRERWVRRALEAALSIEAGAGEDARVSPARPAASPRTSKRALAAASGNGSPDAAASETGPVPPRASAETSCQHNAARVVREDGGAVFCGLCDAELEPVAEDLRRMAAAPPMPASVPYAEPKPTRSRSSKKAEPRGEGTPLPKYARKHWA